MMKTISIYLLAINYQEYSLTSCQRTRHLVTEVHMALGNERNNLTIHFCTYVTTVRVENFAFFVGG